MEKKGELAEVEDITGRAQHTIGQNRREHDGEMMGGRHRTAGSGPVTESTHVPEFPSDKVPE